MIMKNSINLIESLYQFQLIVYIKYLLVLGLILNIPARFNVTLGSKTDVSENCTGIGTIRFQVILMSRSGRC